MPFTPLSGIIYSPGFRMRNLLLAFFLCLAPGASTRATAQRARYRAAQDSLTAELEALRSQGHFTGFGVALVTRYGRSTSTALALPTRKPKRPTTYTPCNPSRR